MIVGHQRHAVHRAGLLADVRLLGRPLIRPITKIHKRPHPSRLAAQPKSGPRASLEPTSNAALSFRDATRKSTIEMRPSREELDQRLDLVSAQRDLAELGEARVCDGEYESARAGPGCVQSLVVFVVESNRWAVDLGHASNDTRPRTATIQDDVFAWGSCGVP
jgi:hypothetical protein